MILTCGGGLRAESEGNRMAIYREDIVNIELTGGTVSRTFMNHTIGSGDEDANRFGVRLFRNGEAENVGGGCTGYFIRADGETVVITGAVSGNLAYVTLPETCYAVEVNFTLAIKCTGGSVTGTMRIVDGTVAKTSSSAIVDPGTLVDGIDDLIEAIEDAVASIPEDYSALSETAENTVDVLKLAMVGESQADNWEQGSINSSTGAASSSTTRIRSINYMKPVTALTLKVPYGMKAYWFAYTAANVSGYDGNGGGWQTGDMLIPADGRYYKVLLAYTDDSTITTAAAENCPLYTFETTDKTLKKAEKAADAKVIGDILKETPVNMRWEQGRIKTDDGSSAAASNRVRTAYYMKPVHRVVFDVPAGYKAILYWYSAPTYTAFVGSTSGSWTTDDIVFDDPAYFYKICLAKSDDADVTPADAAGFAGTDHLARPYLAAAGDSTDRTGEITAMLAMFGKCELSAGDFYTTGITMPDGSMLCGSGSGTRLVLSANGYAVDMGTGCAVRDMDIVGSTGDAIVWGDSEGGKYGIYIHDTDRRNTLVNVNIHGFTGAGIYGLQTGYGVDTGLNASDCNIWNCYIGIYLKLLSEFHRFGNCRVFNCRYAVVNNGGNNVFSGCTFAANTDHFVIDNTGGQATNNAHGCMTGCNFQHSGFDRSTGTSDESGNAITLINTGSGYIFSGCVIGDGHVVITDCYRINFSGCQFMEDLYTEISGGGLVAYCGCEMRSTFEEYTTITGNTAVKFDACYTGGGTKVDPTD